MGADREVKENIWFSISERVSEFGCFGAREILSSVTKLSDILEKSTASRLTVTPDTVEISFSGDIRISDRKTPSNIRQKYIAPEKLKSSHISDVSSNIYAIGILMLYMATGNVDKTELDCNIDSKVLKTVICRCIDFDPEKRFHNYSELTNFIRKSRNRAGRLTAIAVGICALFAGSYLLGSYLYSLAQIKGETEGSSTAYSEGYAYGYESGYADARGIGIGETPYNSKQGNLFGNYSADEKGAYSVRSEDYIYFVNDGIIYSMNPYTEEIDQLVDRTDVCSINYYNGCLYYCTDDGVFCYNISTEKEGVVFTEKKGKFIIVDGQIILHESAGAGYLYSYNLAGGKNKQLNGLTNINTFNYSDGFLFYSSKLDGYRLHRCNPDGSADTVICSECCKSICVFEGSVYCGTDEGLISVSLDGGSTRKLTDMKTDCINVTETGIFYISGNERYLEWMSFDGRVRYTVIQEKLKNYNISGRWVFYQGLDTNSIYQIRVSG